jgi:hypothetical protein
MFLCAFDFSHKELHDVSRKYDRNCHFFFTDSRWKMLTFIGQLVGAAIKKTIGKLLGNTQRLLNGLWAIRKGYLLVSFWKKVK